MDCRQTEMRPFTGSQRMNLKGLEDLFYPFSVIENKWQSKSVLIFRIIRTRINELLQSLRKYEAL